MTNSGNCYACQEVWLDVPETDGRYQISNHGHLRQMGRKERFGKTMKTVFTNVAKQLVSNYKTFEFGWYIFIDGEKKFLRRNELMELFIAINIPVEINICEEHMAVKIRKETVKDINGSDGSDRKSTRLNSSHTQKSRMPSSASSDYAFVLPAGAGSISDQP